MVRSRRWLLFSGLGVAAMLVVGAAAYFGADVVALSTDTEKRSDRRASEKAPALKLSADEMRRAGVRVERLEPVQYAETLAAFGTVGPNRNRFARVTPPVAGRLVEIDADLGAQVAAGVRLAVLESPELAEARSAHLQTQTELDLARTNFERAQKLAVDSSIAQKDLLRARADYERARAALAATEARLATLGVAAAAPSGTSPAYFAVNAPISGTVVERTAVLGEYAQAYQPLFTVADLSAVWVETNLYDRDLSDVTIGSRATVTVAAYRGQRFSGKVTYIGHILDKGTHTTVARIEVASPDLRLKPGLFANVEIEKGPRHSALRVPETAVVLVQGQMTVFVAHDDGFEPRPVEIGERNGGMVIVKSGLEPGDEVVVAGAYALKARMLKSLIGESD